MANTHKWLSTVFGILLAVSFLAFGIMIYSLPRSWLPSNVLASVYRTDMVLLVIFVGLLAWARLDHKGQLIQVLCGRWSHPISAVIAAVFYAISWLIIRGPVHQAVSTETDSLNRALGHIAYVMMAAWGPLIVLFLWHSFRRDTLGANTDRLR